MTSSELPAAGRSPLDKPKRLIVSRMNAGGRQKLVYSLPDVADDNVNGEHRELWCLAAEEALTPYEILGVRKEKKKRIYFCCLSQRNQGTYAFTFFAFANFVRTGNDRYLLIY